MVKLIWNEEDAKKSYYRQGIDEGIEQGKLSMIRGLLEANAPIELIRKASCWMEKAILQAAAR